MSVTIEIENCKDCPYLKSDRHFYCGKEFDSNPEAYHAGRYAEWRSELDWLFKKCPLKK